MDAIVFFAPRKSQLDVVQAVGRVMRTSPGKKFGYVILPVVVPAGVDATKALDDNKTFAVIWQVLCALRSHDDRLNATVNQIRLNNKPPDQIAVRRVLPGEQDAVVEREVQGVLSFDDLREAIYARLVIRVGNRRYWQLWSHDIAKIARTCELRIRELVKRGDATAKSHFSKFVAELGEMLNPQVSENDAIEMLAQHIVTRPIFETLFDTDFADSNPISAGMNKVLGRLDKFNISAEAEGMKKNFEKALAMDLEGIDASAGRQKLLLELYSGFFSQAFRMYADRLGIVYTPVEIVDFMLKSVDAALRQHFGSRYGGLTDRDVKVLDPFAGAGTYMARLLDGKLNLIQNDDIRRKFAKEMYACEIMLLPYYIASLNVGAEYSRRSGLHVSDFPGLVFADTFHLATSKQAKINEMFPANHERAKAFRDDRDVRVIVGNPPYSANQRANFEDNANWRSQEIDDRIRETYSERSSATAPRGLYDPYIRAFRFASDRIGDRGLICYITNGSFISGRATDGLRDTLMSEFSDIYCMNLLGNWRAPGKERKKAEGQNVFGQSCGTTVAITLLIKDPDALAGKARLHYYEVPHGMATKEKLELLNVHGSYDKIGWQSIVPDNKNNWLNQLAPEYESFLPLGLREVKQGKSSAATVFSKYSLGLITKADPYVYDYSFSALSKRAERLVQNFNRIARKRSIPSPKDPKLLPWSHEVCKKLVAGKKIAYDQERIRSASFRPFAGKWIYYCKGLLAGTHRLPEMYPSADVSNPTITVSTLRGMEFSAIMVDNLFDSKSIGDTQGFPLYWHPKKLHASGSIFSSAEAGQSGIHPDDEPARISNISEATLNLFRRGYKDAAIAAEDIFYHVYGIFHSRDYREKYASELQQGTASLPAIPRLGSAGSFRAFAAAGRQLAKIHLEYLSAQEYAGIKIEQRDILAPLSSDAEKFAVKKMKFAKLPDGEIDRTRITYNDHIQLVDIPLDAYAYRIAGTSAIESVMNSYQIRSDQKGGSGIVSDPNVWRADEEGEQRADYIVSLVRKIVTVSLDTMQIVDNMPPLGKLEGWKRRT